MNNCVKHFCNYRNNVSLKTLIKVIQKITESDAISIKYFRSSDMKLLEGVLLIQKLSELYSPYVVKLLSHQYLLSLNYIVEKTEELYSVSFPKFEGKAKTVRIFNGFWKCSCSWSTRWGTSCRQILAVNTKLPKLLLNISRSIKDGQNAYKMTNRKCL